MEMGNNAKPGIGNGNEPLGMEGNGIEKTFPLTSTLFTALWMDRKR